MEIHERGSLCMRRACIQAGHYYLCPWCAVAWRYRYTGSMATNTNTNTKAVAAPAPTATATAPAPAPAPTPAQTKAATATKVLHMRNVQLMAWRTIGGQLGFSPKTARAYYQLAAGTHQHHGLLPGKGGRLPAGYVAATATALVAPGTAAWQARTPGTPGVAGTKGGAVAAPAPAPAPAAKAPRPRKPKAPTKA